MKKGIVVLGTLVAAVVLASCGMGSDKLSYEERIDRGIDRADRMLRLTDAQEKDIEKIAYKDIKKLEAVREERIKTRKELAELIKSNQLSAKAIDSYIDQHIARLNAMRPIIKEKALGINSVLTDEQREELAEHMLDDDRSFGRKGHRRLR
jgi:Spy/CpxP family protein refolding chaperone